MHCKTTPPSPARKNINEHPALLIATHNPEGGSERSVCWIAPGGEVIHSEYKAKAMARRMAHTIRQNGEHRAFRRPHGVSA